MSPTEPKESEMGENWQRIAEAMDQENECPQNENTDLRSKLQALERQRDEARVELRRVILSGPANAEGIASEGGSAKAANPHEVLTDAPSAEAGQVWEREVEEEFRWGQTMPAGTSVGPWKRCEESRG